MKKIVALVALLAALMMLACCLAEEADLSLPDAFVIAEYSDETGMYVVSTTQGNDGTFSFEARMIAEDGTAYVWYLYEENVYDEAFDYADCTCFRIPAYLDADAVSVEVETVYEDGTGHIVHDGDLLYWTNTTDDNQVTLALAYAYISMKYVEENTAAYTVTIDQYGETSEEMVVTIKFEDGTYYKQWNMVLEWSDSANAYVYEDGSYACCDINHDFDVVDSYDDGKGTFALMEDLSLTWSASSHNDNGNLHFVQAYVD